MSRFKRYEIAITSPAGHAVTIVRRTDSEPHARGIVDDELRQAQDPDGPEILVVNEPQLEGSGRFGVQVVINGMPARLLVRATTRAGARRAARVVGRKIAAKLDGTHV